MEKPDVNEALDSIPASMFRGVKKLATAVGRHAFGMKSNDGLLDLQDGVETIVDSFIGFAKQQGFKRDGYTLDSFLSFLTARYQYTPDVTAMSQLAEWTKKTFAMRETFEVAAKSLIAGQFERDAWLLYEAKKPAPDEAPSSTHIKDLQQALADGHLATIKKAIGGEENLTQVEVRAVGGPQRLMSLISTYDYVQKTRAANVSASSPNASASTAVSSDAQPDNGARMGGNYDDTPKGHAQQWEDLRRVLPGRNRPLSRMQMDAVATVVARDMLRRGLMSRPGEEGAKSVGGSSDKASAGGIRRNPSIDAISPSGSMVSMPYFIQYLKHAGVTVSVLQEMEVLSLQNHFRDLADAAYKSEEVGQSKAILVSAAFAMAFRMKKEQRKNEDDYRDSGNRYVSCRDMADLLREEGISNEVMEKLNKIGEESHDVKEVARTLLQKLGNDTLSDIIACIMSSLRFLSVEDRKQFMNGEDA